MVLIGNSECNKERGFKNQLYIELGIQEYDLRTCFGIGPKTKYGVVSVVHHSEPKEESAFIYPFPFKIQWLTILFTLLRFQGGFSLNFPGLFNFKVRLRTKPIKKLASWYVYCIALSTLHTENKLFSKAVRADRKFLDRQATHYSNLKEYSSLYIK